MRFHGGYTPCHPDPAPTPRTPCTPLPPAAPAHCSSTPHSPRAMMQETPCVCECSGRRGEPLSTVENPPLNVAPSEVENRDTAPSEPSPPHAPPLTAAPPRLLLLSPRLSCIIFHQPLPSPRPAPPSGATKSLHCLHPAARKGDGARSAHCLSAPPLRSVVRAPPCLHTPPRALPTRC